MKHTDSKKLFAMSLCLIHESGDKLYPVRMKDRTTGTLAFRVSKGGNTKADAIEVFDEERLRDFVVNKSYAVRATTLNKSRKGLYKASQFSIRDVVTPSEVKE